MSVQVLECRRFSATYQISKKVRVVKDYEIDLELGGQRHVVIDGIPYTLKRGDVCIRKPGQTIYGQSPPSLINQSTILLTVNFSEEQSTERYSRNVEGRIQKKWDSPLMDDLNSVITPRSEISFVSIYTELLSLAFTDRTVAEPLVMELIYRLHAEVCRQNYLKNKPAETYCSRIFQYMKNNLEKKITLEELAELVHLNQNYLVRLYKKTYGQTPMKTLIDLRMERACDLVTNTDLAVSEIAAVCGYPSSAYFIAEYKKHFGTTPSRQRNGDWQKEPFPTVLSNKKSPKPMD